MTLNVSHSLSTFTVEYGWRVKLDSLLVKLEGYHEILLFLWWHPLECGELGEVVRTFCLGWSACNLAPGFVSRTDGTDRKDLRQILSHPAGSG